VITINLTDPEVSLLFEICNHKVKAIKSKVFYKNNYISHLIRKKTKFQMTRQETTEHPEDIQEQEQLTKESKSVTGGNKKELLQHCAQFKKARVSVHSKNSPE
jgi:hypothetical protein